MPSKNLKTENWSLPTSNGDGTSPNKTKMAAENDIHEVNRKGYCKYEKEICINILLVIYITSTG